MSAAAVLGFGACASEIIENPALMGSLGVLYPLLLGVAMVVWSGLMNAARPGQLTAFAAGAAARFGGLAALWALCMGMVKAMV